MKQGFEVLQHGSSGVSMDESERLALRESLISYMKENPLRNPALGKRSFLSIGYFNSILVASIVVIFAFGGISYAAERSLPGDMLYPFKRSVNENVRGFFAFSNVSKAEFEVNLASRRLDEAQKLQSESKLSGPIATDLSTNLAAHVANFEKQVKSLNSTHDKHVADVESNLQSSFDAHSGIVPILLPGSLFSGTSVSASSSTDSASSTIITATSTSFVSHHTWHGKNHSATTTESVSETIHTENSSGNGRASSNINESIHSESHSNINIDLR
jgi:hypothetical protein